MKTKKSFKKKQSNIYQYDHGLSEAEKECQCIAATRIPSIINQVEWPYSKAIEIANSKSPGIFGSEVIASDDELISIMAYAPNVISQLTKASPNVIDAAVIAFNSLVYDQNTKVTHEMITTAISKCGMLLRCTRDRTEERSYLAICNTIEAIQWIKNPSKRIVDVASQTVRGLTYMLGKNRNWTPITEELISIASEKMNNYSVVRDWCYGPAFRRALFSLIDQDQALFYLDFDWMYDSVECEDFVEEPCDRIKEILISRRYRSIKTYQKRSPKSWTLSEEIQLMVAMYPSEFKNLKDPCIKAQVACIEKIAGIEPSGKYTLNDEICIKALSNAPNKNCLRNTYGLIICPSLSVTEHYIKFLKMKLPVNPPSPKTPVTTCVAEIDGIHQEIKISPMVNKRPEEDIPF